MKVLETRVDAGDVALSATVTIPEKDAPVGGIVVLHGAMAPGRDFFLYEHLADLANDQGWAVLRYDRRPWERETIPFDIQTSDALAALVHLREVAELDGKPAGMWGVSQGAWAATVAAANDPSVAFLILVGFSGWTPGRQMRFLTANLLTRDGYGDEDLEELSALRDTYESFTRGEVTRDEAQHHIDRIRSRPWFDLAYVAEELPPHESIRFPGLWDFDPTGPLSDVRCPVLAIWGDEDAEAPPEQSSEIVRTVRAEAATETRVEVLDGVGHALTRGGEYDADALDPGYEGILVEWLHQQAKDQPTV